MKRFILCSLLSLVCLLSFAATERVYVLTDRSAYLAGDRVWCSLFCVDENGSLSQQSAIAYLELVSSEGSAVQAKISLMEGRGAGEFTLPVNIPSGNYRLVAYTSLEGGQASSQGSRLLSIYNPWSLARVDSGVVLGSKPELYFEKDTLDVLYLELPQSVNRGDTLDLRLSGIEADLCISVYHEDSLSQMSNGSLGAFLSEFPVSPEAGGPLEFDGEVIRGTVLNADDPGLAILSSSGSTADIYVSPTVDGNKIRFQTGNIYGERELVCEMIDGGENIRILLDSPFQRPESGLLPALCLDESQRAALSLGRQAVGAQYIVDTLVRFLPRREDLFLRPEDMTRIHLDDYTRFPSVQEIVVEILPMVRIRKHYGKKQLELAVADGSNQRTVFMDHILVMMDGVIIPDFDLMMSLDAMLLEDIFIYSGRIVIGPAIFNGAINFVSKRNYVTALDFPSNVCVVDYSGARYPVAYLGGAPAGEDLRQLLYWHPSLILGESESIRLIAPDYSGRFCVVAEGLTADGKAVRAVKHFDVR